MPWKEVVARVPSLGTEYGQHAVRRAQSQHPRERVERGSKARRLWTEEEDSKLCKLKAAGMPYDAIAAAIPGRTTKAVSFTVVHSIFVKRTEHEEEKGTAVAPALCHDHVPSSLQTASSTRKLFHACTSRNG